MKRLTCLLPLICLGLCTVALASEEGKVYQKEVRVTPLLKANRDAAGRMISYPKGEAELSAVLVEIPVGAKTGWHEHPVPSLAYILEGELQVEMEGGIKRTIKRGETFAEVVHLLHSGQNFGPKPVKLILFVAGIKNQPFAVKK